MSGSASRTRPRQIRHSEAVRRSVAKAVTFRALAMAANGAIVYSLTGEYVTTAGVVLVTSFTSTVLYIAHERLWNSVHWGRRHLQL